MSILQWFAIYLWHGLNRKGCTRVEMSRPFDYNRPIMFTCRGCGRTNEEYM